MYSGFSTFLQRHFASFKVCYGDFREICNMGKDLHCLIISIELPFLTDQNSGLQTIGPLRPKKVFGP